MLRFLPDESYGTPSLCPFQQSRFPLLFLSSPKDRSVSGGKARQVFPCEVNPGVALRLREKLLRYATRGPLVSQGDESKATALWLSLPLR